MYDNIQDMTCTYYQGNNNDLLRIITETLKSFGIYDMW